MEISPEVIDFIAVTGVGNIYKSLVAMLADGKIKLRVDRCDKVLYPSNGHAMGVLSFLTEEDTERANQVLIFGHTKDVTISYIDKNNGFSVRCIKD